MGRERDRQRSKGEIEKGREKGLRRERGIERKGERGRGEREAKV